MLNDISILQFLLAAIAGAFLLKSILKFVKREKNQTFFKFFTNVSVWGTVFFFSLFPQLSHSITSLLGFGENLNTLIFLGFIMVFAILFKIINIIERIERNISEIVRKEALENIDLAKK